MIKRNNPVFFAESEWMLKLAREGFPSLTFHKTSDFKVLRKQSMIKNQEQLSKS